MILCASCLFGLEGIVAEELRRLGAEDVMPETGRVVFSGGWDLAAAANLRLRCAERVMVRLGKFPAASFDALFEGTRALPWEEYIPQNAAFPVGGYCLDSELYSVPDCQAIVKKAVVERLKRKYPVDWFTEGGPKYQIKFGIHKDQAALYLDTTGPALHKRGYRPAAGEAPLRETLAAALVLLIRYKGLGPFCDPFCGSGTLPIEAALIARNRAPGLHRKFDAMAWTQAPPTLWTQQKEAAVAAEFDRSYDIWGGDRDASILETAKENAKRAGVMADIRFGHADIKDFRHGASRGAMLCNPPYGERLLTRREAEDLARLLGRVTAGLDGWRIGVLTSDPDFDRHFGRKASKRRKLYNGTIPCGFYVWG
jgi:putative N6-adenine-specific DNA methylase